MDGSDPEARRRFERECRLTGRLSGHPNVVTVRPTDGPGPDGGGCDY